MAEHGAGDHGVDRGHALPQGRAEHPRLLDAEVGETVVFGGAERGLAVPDEVDRAHRPSVGQLGAADRAMAARIDVNHLATSEH